MFNKTSEGAPHRDSFAHKFFSRVPDLRTEKQRFEDHRVVEESMAEGQREFEEHKRRQEAKQRRPS